MNIVREIEMFESRCYDCGHFWAVERPRANSATCPVCAQKNIRAAQERADAAERQAAAARGAATRAAKRAR